MTSDISAPDTTDTAPVAPEQTLMLRRMVTNPNPIAYHVMLRLSLTGDLDTAAMLRSLGGITAAHHAFRARFERHGEGWTQVIGPPRTPLVDVVAARPDELDALCDELIRRPFAIEDGYLLRGLLVRTGDRTWELILAYHHLIMDSWSQQLFLDELAARYRAEVSMGPPPEPVSRQCIDYARSGATEPPAADLDYWLTELAGVSQVLPLGDGGFAGRGLPLEVPAPAGLHDRLVSAAAASGTTLFLTIATAVAIQLSRLTGRRSVVLSVPFVNRAPVDHSVITCASSPIFLRCDVDDETPFTELAWRVTERFMAAIDHLAVPTTTLLDALVARGGWRTDQPPSVALVMEGELNRDVDGFPGLTARLGDHRFHGVAHVDLLFNVKLAPPDFSILTVYNEDRLTAGTVRSWIEDLLRLLAGIAAEPGRPPGRQ